MRRYGAHGWGAVIVSVIILLTFDAMVFLLLTHEIPQSALALANTMCGTLATMSVAVVQYWVGSSASSRSKDALLAQATSALAVSVPISAANSNTAPPEEAAKTG